MAAVVLLHMSAHSGDAEPLDVHYRNDVISGNGPLVMVAESRANFAEAILNKLVLEIAGRGPDNGGRAIASD